jgi:hypothetical protein
MQFYAAEVNECNWIEGSFEHLRFFSFLQPSSAVKKISFAFKIRENKKSLTRNFIKISSGLRRKKVFLFLSEKIFPLVESHKYLYGSSIKKKSIVAGE